ncbi:MAG TPA: hypothetical protein PKN32_12765 [Bacteroidales bacterium]|nr:hypothetical protein [Bacteroidales bacterium]
MEKIFYLIFILPLFYCGTCNHEKVNGKIEASSLEVEVGDTVFLEAVIIDKDKVLKKIMWEADPVENNVLISLVVDNNDSTEYKAFFISNESGKYRVILSCFYKQTNPTYIDEVDIIVK